jgi:uncharacterized protein with GYD domain
MPFYLTRFSYTPETWARLIEKPEDRRAAAQRYIETVGGKMHGFWYAFGDHDAYNLWEAPDNVSMAAVAVAISAQLIRDDSAAHRRGDAGCARESAVGRLRAARRVIPLTRSYSGSTRSPTRIRPGSTTSA